MNFIHLKLLIGTITEAEFVRKNQKATCKERFCKLSNKDGSKAMLILSDGVWQGWLMPFVAALD